MDSSCNDYSYSNNETDDVMDENGRVQTTSDSWNYGAENDSTAHSVQDRPNWKVDTLGQAVDSVDNNATYDGSGTTFDMHFHSGLEQNDSFPSQNEYVPNVVEADAHNHVLDFEADMEDAFQHDYAQDNAVGECCAQDHLTMEDTDANAGMTYDVHEVGDLQEVEWYGHDDGYEAEFFDDYGSGSYDEW